MAYAGIKSIENLPERFKKMISDVSDERGNGDGVWIYLKEEYADLNHDPFWNCRDIHEQTVKGCIERLKGAKLVTPENTNEGDIVNPNRFK